MDHYNKAKIDHQNLRNFNLSQATQKHSVGFRQLRNVDFQRLNQSAIQRCSVTRSNNLLKEKIDIMRKGSNAVRDRLRASADLKSIQEHETLNGGKGDLVYLPSKTVIGSDIITSA